MRSSLGCSMLSTGSERLRDLPVLSSPDPAVGGPGEDPEGLKWLNKKLVLHNRAPTGTAVRALIQKLRSGQGR